MRRMPKQKLPNMSKPCPQCPFRKDSLIGWLSAERMEGIIQQDSFVCHNNTNQQCAGHMLLLDVDNAFVRLAKGFKIPLDLRGRDLIFDTKEDCIEHHRNGRDK